MHAGVEDLIKKSAAKHEPSETKSSKGGHRS
jgi:hypothetical protein